ncbi:hypothetical protein AMR41_30815 [Hapalosiphon sp. MRB220]|nr:hypothetical protein AMR41_30815 [Hapalosiphon sp. MRB220]
MGNCHEPFLGDCGVATPQCYPTWLDNPVLLTADDEMMEVNIFPPHCQLNRVMQIFYCAIAADFHTPPNHGADAQQHHF